MRSILRNPGSVLLAFAVMAAGATVVACATSSSGMDVTFDYDTGANFAALKSYSWMPPTGNAVGDELLVKRIKTTVDSQLQAKGPVPAEANPDFLIGMQLSGKSTYGGSTGVGVSVGIPVGRAGRVSVGGGKSQAIEKKEGTLVLDFVVRRASRCCGARLLRAPSSRSRRPSSSSNASTRWSRRCCPTFRRRINASPGCAVPAVKQCHAAKHDPWYITDRCQ
jgi:hypothetical protein